VAVIALHKWGKSDSQIFQLLKPLKISRNFVCRAIKRYKELGGVEDGTGCLKSVWAEAAVKTVREWIRRNLLWKQIVS
jgi:transposase